MKSSNTSSWDSIINQKISSDGWIGRQALITSSAEELVEFYWTNRKRFARGYRGFPARVN